MIRVGIVSAQLKRVLTNAKLRFNRIPGGSVAEVDLKAGQEITLVRGSSVKKNESKIRITLFAEELNDVLSDDLIVSSQRIVKTISFLSNDVLLEIEAEQVFAATLPPLPINVTVSGIILNKSVGFHLDESMTLISVDEDTPAFNSELPSHMGDQLIHINNKPALCIDDVRKLVPPSGECVFGFKRILDAHRPTTTPQVWRVVGTAGARVRIKERIHSRVISIIATGSLIEVIQTRGRRARLKSPTAGWVSTEDADGGIIIECEASSRLLGMCEICKQQLAMYACSECKTQQCKNCCDAAHPVRGNLIHKYAPIIKTVEDDVRDVVSPGGPSSEKKINIFTKMYSLVSNLTENLPVDVPHSWLMVCSETRSMVFLKKMIDSYEPLLKNRSLPVCLDSLVLNIWRCRNSSEIFDFCRIIAERIDTSQKTGIISSVYISNLEYQMAASHMRQKEIDACAMLCAYPEAIVVVDAFWEKLCPLDKDFPGWHGYNTIKELSLIVCLLKQFLPSISLDLANSIGRSEVITNHDHQRSLTPTVRSPRESFNNYLISVITRWSDSITDSIRLLTVLQPVATAALELSQHLTSSLPSSDLVSQLARQQFAVYRSRQESRVRKKKSVSKSATLAPISYKDFSNYTGSIPWRGLSQPRKSREAVPDPIVEQLVGMTELNEFLISQMAPPLTQLQYTRLCCQLGGDSELGIEAGVVLNWFSNFPDFDPNLQHQEEEEVRRASKSTRSVSIVSVRQSKKRVSNVDLSRDSSPQRRTLRRRSSPKSTKRTGKKRRQSSVLKHISHIQLRLQSSVSSEQIDWETFKVVVEDFFSSLTSPSAFIHGQTIREVLCSKIPDYMNKRPTTQARVESGILAYHLEMTILSAEDMPGVKYITSPVENIYSNEAVYHYPTMPISVIRAGSVIKLFSNKITINEVVYTYRQISFNPLQLQLCFYNLREVDGKDGVIPFKKVSLPMPVEGDEHSVEVFLTTLGKIRHIIDISGIWHNIPDIIHIPLRPMEEKTYGKHKVLKNAIHTIMSYSSVYSAQKLALTNSEVYDIAQPFVEDLKEPYDSRVASITASYDMLKKLISRDAILSLCEFESRGGFIKSNKITTIVAEITSLILGIGNSNNYWARFRSMFRQPVDHLITTFSQYVLSELTPEIFNRCCHLRTSLDCWVPRHKSNLSNYLSVQNITELCPVLVPIYLWLRTVLQMYSLHSGTEGGAILGWHIPTNKRIYWD